MKKIAQAAAVAAFLEACPGDPILIFDNFEQLARDGAPVLTSLLQGLLNWRVLYLGAIYFLIQACVYGVVYYLPPQVGRLLGRNVGFVVGSVAKTDTSGNSTPITTATTLSGSASSTSNDLASSFATSDTLVVNGTTFTFTLPVDGPPPAIRLESSRHAAVPPKP